MREDDIDRFMKAKDRYSYGNVIYVATVALAVIAALSTFIPVLQEYTKYLVLAAFVVGTSTYGVGSRSYVSRNELLNILERQVNTDPKAIEYIARQSSGKINKNA